ncbi:MAG TPA: YkvA family protein [Thermosynechococcaceae cyanobacterium]
MNFSIQAVYSWYRNAIRNPKYRIWVILGSLLYLLSPIDISPDFLPIVGWIDDGVIATLLVAEVSQLLLERLKPAKTETATATTTEASTVDVNAVSAD